MTELRRLASTLGVSERTLRRAADQGTLRATRRSPRTLQLPLLEEAYIRRTWPLLSALREGLRTEHNVRAAILFGSIANGTDTPASDIDVVVDLADPDLNRVLDLSAKLTDLVGRSVDLYRFEDVQSESAIVTQVLAEGRVLVDREGLWLRLKRSARALERRAGDDNARRVKKALEGIDALLAV
jgi:predicted nucleotidyltransferase